MTNYGQPGGGHPGPWRGQRPDETPGRPVQQPYPPAPEPYPPAVPSYPPAPQGHPGRTAAHPPRPTVQRPARPTVAGRRRPTAASRTPYGGSYQPSPADPDVRRAAVPARRPVRRGPGTGSARSGAADRGTGRRACWWWPSPARSGSAVGRATRRRRPRRAVRPSPVSPARTRSSPRRAPPRRSRRPIPGSRRSASASATTAPPAASRSC